MKKLRAAIIGLGAIYEKHAQAIVSGEDSELVALCDKSAEALAAACAKYAVSGYTDYREMIDIKKPDVVHICLPHYLHKKAAIYCMKNGCNVVLEKPAGINISQVKTLLEANEEMDNSLCIIMQNRYNKASVALKNALDSGKLGKIKDAYIEVLWSRSKEYYSESEWRGTLKGEGGGTIINQSIHTLDLLLWFENQKVKSINATLKTLKHDIEVEDYATGNLTFKDGTIAGFTFSNNEDKNYPVKIILNCQKGIAKIIGTKLEIEYDTGEVAIVEEEYDNQHEKGYWGSSHDKQIHNFYAYLLGKEELFVKPEDVLYTHKIVFELLSFAKQHN